MSNEVRPHRGLLDFIVEKESELCKIRHATERAIQQEEHKVHQQYLQLRSDFEHNLDLLFQKDELIQSLQTQIIDTENHYKITLKDLEDQNEKIERKKIYQIQRALQEEWCVYARQYEEDQRNRLAIEYEDKLLRSQKALYAEHQQSILDKLRNQEKEIWTNFETIIKEKQSLHERLLGELKKEVIAKNRDKERTMSTIEDKWGERESELRHKIAGEFELKINKLRQEIELVQKDAEDKIAKLTGEQQQLIKQNTCLNRETQDLHEVNDELNRKVNDLLVVIESAERGFVIKIQDAFKAEATAKNDMQLKCDHIISLQAELNKQSDHHEEFTKKLKNKRSEERIKFNRNITELKKELKYLQKEKEKSQASQDEAKYSKRQLEDKIDVLNSQCSELKENLKCVQNRLNINVESMSEFQTENNKLITCMCKSNTNMQLKEAIICQLKKQIFEDKQSFEEKQQQVTSERKIILKEKEEALDKIDTLENKLDGIEMELLQSKEERRESSLAETQKESELRHSLQQSQLQNDKLKETIALMRKEMELVTLPPDQFKPQASLLSDSTLKRQFNELRSQLNQILKGRKITPNDDNKDPFKYSNEDLSISTNNSIQELDFIIEYLSNENKRGHTYTQACANLTQTQVSDLSRELKVVTLERNNLLELSNKLRSDLHKLNGSIPTFGQETQTTRESRERISPCNSINYYNRSDEVDHDDLAKSMWHRVVGTDFITTNAVKKFQQGNDRTTVSKKTMALKSKNEETKMVKKCSSYINKVKVRNWSHKDDE